MAFRYRSLSVSPSPSPTPVDDFLYLTEPDDALKCLICLFVAKDPRQHEECGKLFCKECIERYGKHKPCPNCMKRGQFYKDHKSNREITGLQVKCKNVERKCEWVGTVGAFEKHVVTCQFALLPCPKECKDDTKKIKHFMRKDLDEHLKKDCPERDHTCEYCGEEGTYAHLTGDHDESCIKKTVPCPNDGCTDTMQRQHVEEHVTTECEYTKTPCKYRRLGCDAKLKRNDLAVHEEDDKLHLHMALDTTVKLEEKISRLEKDVNVLTLKNGEPLKFKLTDYQKRVDKDELVESPSYYLSPNGYRMAIRVHANGRRSGEGTHVSVFANILKGRNDAELKWPFIGKITFTLLNQLEDKNHHQEIMDVTAAKNVQAGGPGRGYPKFIPHSWLSHDPVENTQYLKDDTLYFRMSVEVDDHKHKPWLK